MASEEMSFENVDRRRVPAYTISSPGELKEDFGTLMQKKSTI